MGLVINHDYYEADRCTYFYLNFKLKLIRFVDLIIFAGIAQSVEQLIRN